MHLQCVHCLDFIRVNGFSFDIGRHTFQTACPSERQALINAMNALHELRRVSENSGSNVDEKTRKLTQAA